MKAVNLPSLGGISVGRTTPLWKSATIQQKTLLLRAGEGGEWVISFYKLKNPRLETTRAIFKLLSWHQAQFDSQCCSLPTGTKTPQETFTGAVWLWISSLGHPSLLLLYPTRDIISSPWIHSGRQELKLRAYAVLFSSLVFSLDSRIFILLIILWDHNENYGHYSHKQNQFLLSESIWIQITTSFFTTQMS